MPFPLIPRPQLLLLCALLFAPQVGCAKQGDRAALTDERPEGGPNADEEAPMAKRPKHGFYDYVKNPDIFRRHFQERGTADSAPPPTPRKAEPDGLGLRPVRRAGVMAIVLAGGDVRPGDAIRVEPPPTPHRPLAPV